MAKKDEPETPDKSKGGKMKIIIIALVMLGVGAGGAYGAFAAGLIGAEADSGPDVPELVRKGESDPYSPPGDTKDSGPVIYGDGGSEFRTAYYGFEDSFTSNLSDSPGLIQVELAVSTRHDGRVLQWVGNHELAIRSAILAQLAATPEADVYSVEGKEDLSKRLTAAINAVLEENEGFGGIEAVHFKGFLVQ
ncbi:flagellar basal body-associated FliL family protein [Erythrobacter insulae]|uniref:Flagellar protein FliL n=1 Tax=Erythrobacter insulae TaxID=2584124 RepID=A0A547PA91_9SPHN|nr:flagellar basal body-associated FliL family protein [Erythrobacter insulae]TRD11059.1 flagellar basal body-associated FliL family protein [Erythrobacter insulae]